MESDFDYIVSKFSLFELKESSFQVGHFLGEYFKNIISFVKFFGCGNSNFDKIGHQTTKV